MASRHRPGSPSASATTCVSTGGGCGSIAERTRRSRASPTTGRRRKTCAPVQADPRRARSKSCRRRAAAAGSRSARSPPRDGGLELFVTDGELAAALTQARRAPFRANTACACAAHSTRRASQALLQAAGRVRPQPRARSTTVIAPPAAKAAIAGCRWKSRGLAAAATCGRSSRPAASKPTASFARAIGPIAMDRVLARGRSRPLTDDELNALRESARAMQLLAVERLRR